MSQDMLEAIHDKFVFKVKQGYLYHWDECWIKEDGELLTIGITDFLQKTSGDVAFLELPEIGAEVEQSGKAGVIETIKATVDLISPASGMIKEVNSALEADPQFVNSEPYEAGWLFKIAPSKWEAEKNTLMKAEEYFPVMEEKIKQQVEK
ncbi:MAG: Glycine cleavage system H protein [Pelotomaculum sp. PtaB.Bin104]|nr:MAG: Glycine cleavage system H protein [Pelotomaculum sp. PtaB.Bin104]